MPWVGGADGEANNVLVAWGPKETLRTNSYPAIALLHNSLDHRGLHIKCICSVQFFTFQTLINKPMNKAIGRFCVYTYMYTYTHILHIYTHTWMYIYHNLVNATISWESLEAILFPQGEVTNS